ncbi:MAG TPA: outer-membrane lipoprotein carrier protein LolA [Caulobacteraceae bacterium]|jgi:outer membrane lipoprotein-sorting protein
MVSPIPRRLALALVVGALCGAAGAAPLAAPDQALVERARDYLRGLSSAMGRFTQTDPRGHVATGTFYLRRPGRARFEYDPPSGLVVASNGFRVAVLDRRLGTLDAYPLGATPLGILLSRDIRIDKGVMIGSVSRRAGGFSIVAYDAGKRGQGQISLDFTENPLVLAGWTITDARGGLTRVKLVNFAPGKAMPNRFFELAPTPAAKPPAN